MLSKFVERVPLTTKVRMGLSAVGVGNQEQEAIDSFIARLGGNPVMSIVLGQEVSSLSGVVTLFDEWAKTDAQELALGIPTLRRLLGDVKGRDMLATVILDTINRSPEKDTLVGVIDKLSKAPLPGFGDTNYPDIRSFLTNGVFPMVGKILPTDKEQVMGALVTCPYCSQVHIHHIGE